jgi:hypothetical protein
MNLQKFISDVKPHVIVILAFFLVGYLYYLRTFNGYTHSEEDVTQGLLKGSELKKYTDKDGNFPGWTNSIFSGMPSNMIQGKVSANEIKSYNYLMPFSKTSYPFRILFLSFIGFYILMCAFKVKPYIGALAAVAYGFATYSVSSVEAAHYTKVMAMALMPAVLASLHLLFNGKYFLGGVLLAFNMALQIYYFHYQITFYTIVCLLVMGIYYVIHLTTEQKFKQLGIAALILAVGAGVLSNITKIESTSKFADNTMRGGNDMAKADQGVKQKETSKGGLNRDYAFDWSYGKGETFTLLIPNFYGGSSREKLSKSSKFYEMTENEEAINDGLPMYHGDLQFTSGPIYIGAIIIFLFVLGIVVVKHDIKWPLLALTLISFILGWGKHFAVVNNFLFDHLKYYNKFRVPMMAFSIAQVTIPLLGFLGIKYLYDHWQSQKKGTKKPLKNDGAVQPVTSESSKELWDKVKLAFYITGGFCLLMALIGPSIMDMGGSVDEELRKGGNSNMISVLKEDRGSLLRNDAFRSFIFISISFALLWAWYSNKLQKTVALVLVAGFAAIDLIGVDWRYLSWDDFRFEKGAAVERTPDQIDLEILKDKTHYRVFDLTGDPFNNNEGAAFHKMIGGYDAAKLSRYQDLISEFLFKQDNQNAGLDMLNCKYLIGTDSGKRAMSPRLTNNGNAWFVKTLHSTPNASLEMAKLKSIDNKKEATFNSDTADFKNNKNLKPGTFEVDSTSMAKLDSYHPDTLNYTVSNSHDGFLVFSEIYYDNWRAEIDDKLVPLNKVDYTLRGLNVPAGSHKIKLYFDKGKNTTDIIERWVSITILVLMLAMIIIWIKSYFATEKKQVVS